MPDRPTFAEPLHPAGHVLRNRVVATAHGLAAADDGMPNDADAAHRSRMSRGGPAMVITGGAQVSVRPQRCSTGTWLRSHPFGT